MHSLLKRSLIVAACFLFSSDMVCAETIIKLNLGPTGPDIQLQNGVLSTVDDGNGLATSPGDQDTSVTFEEFAQEVAGISNIFPPETASFSLSGVGVIGVPLLIDQGGTGLVVQSTTGGVFSLYDEAGSVLLTGELKAGSLHGHTGAAGTGTSSFLTASLGSFTGPLGTDLFRVLDPDSASLAIGLTDVLSGQEGVPGLLVVDNVIQGFSADATANIGAEPTNIPLPEPSSLGILLIALTGVLGVRSRRSRYSAAPGSDR